jgi:hypothetical protein
VGRWRWLKSLDISRDFRGGATGALLWWTLGDLSKRSGYNLIIFVLG